MTNQANQPVQFELTPIERNDPLWTKLRGHIERCIEQHRQDNDNSHDAAKTAEIRGGIRVLKGLLALDRDPIDLGFQFPAAHSDGK